jgi:hypothetical protein
LPTWRNIVWFVLKLFMQMLTHTYIHTYIHVYAWSVSSSPFYTYKVAVSLWKYENDISGLTPTGNWQKLVVLRNKYLTCHNCCDYNLSARNISRAFRVSCESTGEANTYVTFWPLEGIAIAVLITLRLLSGKTECLMRWYKGLES